MTFEGEMPCHAATLMVRQFETLHPELTSGTWTWHGSAPGLDALVVTASYVEEQPTGAIWEVVGVFDLDEEPAVILRGYMDLRPEDPPVPAGTDNER